NGIEIEECLMVIGRGYYQIHNCKDGDTAIEGIEGTSVSIYDPNKSITGNETIYRTGTAFTSAPRAVRKSDAINGQSLVKPNDLSLESKALYFMTGGVIRNTANIDFTQSFKVGDGIAITGAGFGINDAILSGTAVLTPSFQVIVQSPLDIEAFAGYKGLLLNGASFEYIVEEIIVDPETGESTTVVKDRLFRDVSGQYEVSRVTRTLSQDIYTYTIQLVNAKQVNFNWNDVVEDQTVNAGITLNLNADSMTLDGIYSISAISSAQITLANASTVNAEWLKLPNMFNGSTQGKSTNVELEIVANKWVGWFNIEFEQATQAVFNVYAPQGMYATTDSGGERQAGCTVTVQIQMLDENKRPYGPIINHDWSIWAQTKSSFGRTYRYNLPDKGSFRFRLAKTYAKENNRPVTEVKIKSVYATYASQKRNYPDVTVVRLKTTATDGALSVKDRKLNCLVTRRLRVDGTGAYVATRDAGQALINMALDQYIGRRSASELDIVQIKAEIQKVKNYFGSDAATEFNYTFDDDNLSFEEQAGMIASACFCETHRYGNKLRWKFEGPQDHSVLLFNHRNKVPGSEKRTINIGINKDYDGVELEYTSPDDDIRTTYSIPENGSARNPMKITTSGIRNHAVAKTRAWREWNKLQYQSVSCEFTALDESNLLIRNDRILVADNRKLRTQDGQVEDVSGLTLTLSQDVELKPKTTYFICLQMDSGTVDMISCVMGNNPNEVILSRAPLKQLVVDEDRSITTTYLIVEEQDAKKQAFLLTELSPNDELTNNLTCINYDARYYEKDHSFI
ncbi:host specificity factor TipJ family phage tail protein, partial [Acinetobacter sp. ANC 4558]|uniref:host specificity factor TipJ family phage tail protein n=1 Tax=Acinetobacter sp. ANC 4558 TaxID=1977876 RepID=UPI00148AD59B